MSPVSLFFAALSVSLLVPALLRMHRRRNGSRLSTTQWRKRILAAGAASTLLLCLGLGGVALAEGRDPTGVHTGNSQAEGETVLPKGTPPADAPQRLAQQIAKTQTSLNMTWLIVGGVLVLFMQAGFALVETGFTRAKNAAHTMMMNLVIFALGVVGWFVCGYALMFGATSNAALGLTQVSSPIHIGSWNILAKGGFFLGGAGYDVSVLGFFFFQLVFMDATATIPTGAMAERWKFSSFCVWGLFVSAILYPVYGNWVWGGGWLSQLGVLGPKWGHGALDFAGSGVVHAMGGVAAFWGAKILGPRIGKYDKDGKPRAIPGHHIPMAFLGVFILLVGWMGFNGASTLSAMDLRFPVVITNTVISAAFATVSAMMLMWKKFGKPDPSMTANGMLAGLVAITAPCAFVAPWGAMVIGLVAGVLVVYAVLILDHKLKVDDPVGAVAVHGVNGIWGVLALGIFADGKYGDGFNGVAGGVKGLWYGETGQFLAQLTSAIVLITWCSIACIVFFKTMDRVMGMRSDPEHEIAGLDLPEMGALSYPDFLEAQGSVFLSVSASDQNKLSPASARSSREELGTS